MNNENHSLGDSRSFTELARKFLDKTQEHILQGINPGGIYHAIWCRDASYILKDWFLSGNIQGTMQQIHQIWSHQITSSPIEKVVYGRGSIDMKFLSEVYDDKKRSSPELYQRAYIRQDFPRYMRRNLTLIQPL